jgi:hypothetical protein
MQGVSDGSNELQWRLNNPLITTQASGYTNIVTLDASPDQFPDGNGGHRIYFDATYSINNCLYNEDLAYYLEEADEIIYAPYEPEVGLRPPGKSFISINISDTYVDYSGGSAYVHYYYVTYGNAYTNPD